MKEYYQVLESCALFRGMNAGEISSVLNCIGSELITVKKNRCIYYSTDISGKTGIVLTGSVLLTQEDPEGNRSILTKCLPGDFFGEMQPTDIGSNSDTVIFADSDSEIMLLDLNVILNVCSSSCQYNRNLICNMVTAFADRLTVFTDKITHMNKRTTKDKLMSYLRSESSRQGSESFDIPFDRQELADFLGVDRAAMSAELSKLQKAGLLKTTRNHFELL